MKSMPGGPTTIACSVDAYLQQQQQQPSVKPLLLCASGAQRSFTCVAATTSQPAMYRKQTSQKSYTQKQPIPAYSATSASPEQHKD
jgi:hypothetical protein